MFGDLDGFLFYADRVFIEQFIFGGFDDTSEPPAGHTLPLDSLIHLQ
jgi:hypothetical protein